MGSFNCQHIINSFHDEADDDYFLDIKPFVSDDQTFFPGASTSSRHICSSQAEINHQIQASQKEAVFPQLISFGSQGSPLHDSHMLLEDGVCNIDTNITTRDPFQAQNHVEAERRRRQKLSQLFIALSKIVPGLKKLDKASLLGDAIDHMKELQERVRILEEEINTTSNSLDPKETTFVADQDHRSDASTRRPVQEIKVKFSKANILIKLLCDKDDGLIQRLLGEMGKLHVTVSDFRVIPFVTNTVDITILAEMGSRFSSTVEEVADQVKMAIPNRRPNQDTYAHLPELSDLSTLPELEAWQL